VNSYTVLCCAVLCCDVLPVAAEIQRSGSPYGNIRYKKKSCEL
jgi:hypothetical protein